MWQSSFWADGFWADGFWGYSGVQVEVSLNVDLKSISTFTASASLHVPLQSFVAASVTSYADVHLSVTLNGCSYAGAKFIAKLWQLEKTRLPAYHTSLVDIQYVVSKAYPAVSLRTRK